MSLQWKNSFGKSESWSGTLQVFIGEKAELGKIARI
jgi:hypothetical protein